MKQVGKPSERRVRLVFWKVPVRFSAGAASYTDMRFAVNILGFFWRQSEPSKRDSHKDFSVHSRHIIILPPQITVGDTTYSTDCLID
jgi:hypothetical protein